jgi:hypothetical protein
MDEIPLAAMIEIQAFDTKAIHFPIALVDESPALGAQGLELARRHDAFEDEEALIAIEIRVLGQVPPAGFEPALRP